jgi:hypothetical protein
MLKKIEAGHYEYTVNGITFVIVQNAGVDVGRRTIWSCCLKIGSTHGAAFDAALTLREAKRYCEQDAKRSTYGKPLIEVL